MRIKLGAVSQQSRERISADIARVRGFQEGDFDEMQRFTSCNCGSWRTSITERSYGRLMAEGRSMDWHLSQVLNLVWEFLC